MNRFLSKKAAKELFLITAFPIHFWAVLQMIPHLEWLKGWDFVGVMKYVFINALAESSIVFLGFFIFGGLLNPKKWEEDSKLLLTGIASWGLSLFFMIDQYFSFIVDVDGPIYEALLQMEEVRAFLGLSPWLVVSGLLAGPLTLYMLFLVKKNQKVREGTQKVFEGAILLMYVYVLLDILSIGLIATQNIFWQRGL